MGAREKTATHAWGEWRYADHWHYRSCTKKGCSASQKMKLGGGPVWNIGGARICTSQQTGSAVG
jgi:hypothetical protein